jgi:hypothetical protein
MLHIEERKQVKYRRKRGCEFFGFYLRGIYQSIKFVEKIMQEIRSLKKNKSYF